ncbi:MAG: ribosome recycling factor [Elusimicrobiota bacterium]
MSAGQQVLSTAEDLMKKSIEKLKHSLVSLRTGRASPSLLEGIKVECYNSVMPINQVAGVAIPDSKTIEIKPWDPTIISSIEKAINKSSIGLTPMSDGKVIWLKIPPLTGERRQELVKVAKRIAEEFRVSIRNDRRLCHEEIKKLERDKKIPEDERFKFEAQLQKVTDGYIEQVDSILANKEKGILED